MYSVLVWTGMTAKESDRVGEGKTARVVWQAVQGTESKDEPGVGAMGSWRCRCGRAGCRLRRGRLVTGAMISNPRKIGQRTDGTTRAAHTDTLNWNAIPSNPRPGCLSRPFLRPSPRSRAPSFTTRSPFPSCPCRATPGRGDKTRGREKRRDRERELHAPSVPDPRAPSSFVRPSSFAAARETSIHLSRCPPMLGHDLPV